MKTFLKTMAAAALCAAMMGAQEPGITKQQADEILNELRQIRQILDKQAKLAQEAAKPQEPPVQKAKLKVDTTDMLGKADAPITIVEFTDYQCPFCQRFHSSTFPDLKKNWIDTGKVRFISRDMPLDFHSNAFRAAEAARCAGDQKQFWRMRDVLGSNPSKLSQDNLEKFAQELGLDMPKFKACLDSGKYKATIENDMKIAQSIGVNGTPSFVIGKTTPDGVDGELLVGALPLAMFEQKLNAVQ